MNLTTELPASAGVTTGTVPGWVRVLDGTAVLMLGMAVLLIPGDGVRFDVASVRISISSALRIAVWAAVLIVARHALYRRPALPTRVWHWLRSDVVRSELPFVTRLVLATRVPAIAIGLLAVATIGLGNDLGSQRFETPWLNLLARWDALRYLDIAAFGYAWDGNPMHQQNVVFFPAFPIAARITGRLLGIHMLHAAWLVSLTAFACGMVLFIRLARFSVDESTATASAWLLATYPFAIYFSAAYSESLFFLTMCGMFLAASERRFWLAAVWGIVAGLTRPNGWLLAVPLAVMVFHEQPWPATVRDWLRRGAAVVAPLFGTLLFTLYLQLRFSDGLAWVKGQAAWGRTFRGLHLFLSDRILYIVNAGFTQYVVDQPIDVLNTLAALFALALVVPISRRLGLAYGMLVAVLALPPVLMGGATSMGRMTSVLFPVFIWLAAALPVQRRTTVMVVFAMLQGYAATLFFTWRELY